MIELQKIKLGEVLDVKRGMSLSGDYYATEGDYIRLTLGNFNYPECGWKENTSKDNLYYTGKIRDEFLLQKGDIITPLTEQVRGLLGNTATIPIDGIYIQSGDIGLVLPNEKKLNKRFSYYLIASDLVKKQLDSGSQQTKIRHTSPDAIKECIAFVPNLFAQGKISRLLDLIGDKIDKNNKINDNLQQVIKSCFDFMFAIRKPNGIISDILQEHPKSTIQVNDSTGVLGDYPFFTSGEAINEWQSALVDGMNCYLSTGGNATIKGYYGKAAYSTDTWCVCGKGEYSFYLFCYLKSIIRSINDSFFAGSGLKHLQKDSLLLVNLYIPSEKELEKFNSIVKPAMETMAKLFIETKKLKQQRDFLLPLLMNGQATIAE